MADFRRWGDGGRESELLHAAGFTRRNTRRAMLAFIRDGLAEGEELLELHSVTYRLQMGFLAITDRRCVAGMSWAFLPFVKRRRSVPHRLVASARVRRRAWGTSLDLRSAEDRLRVGNLEAPAAAALRERVLALAERARSQPAVFPAPDPASRRAIDDAPR